MRNKNLNVLLGILMLFSMMTFVVAQPPIEDVVVSAGNVGTSDFSTTTTQPSSTLGGIISEIVETSHKTVKLNGVVVSDKINTTRINNFTLFLFNANAQVNHNNLTIGTAFETSETTNVRGVNGTWTTYNVNSTTTIVDPAGDKSAALNQNFTANDGTFVKATAHGMGSGTNPITFTTGTIPTTQFEIAALCGGLTSAEAKTKSGSTNPGDTFCGTFGTVKVIGVLGLSGAAVRFIYDLDNDGDFNDLTEIVNSSSVYGYKVDAKSGQTLSLIPANIYDIFAVI